MKRIYYEKSLSGAFIKIEYPDYLKQQGCKLKLTENDDKKTPTILAVIPDESKSVDLEVIRNAPFVDSRSSLEGFIPSLGLDLPLLARDNKFGIDLPLEESASDFEVFR